ncbi:MAG: FapA family protein, partial [Chitinivibrionales bacterium]|nr:FapA family protein [Chitinivibrionales bacterium]
PEGPVVIAEGLPIKNGENGKVEFLFNTQTSLKPKQNTDGSVDFKNVSLFTSVVKNDELARLLPPTNGTPGKDITGRDLPCQNGQPSKLPVGPKTVISTEKPDTLIAETEGVVHYNGTLIEIQEGYIIKGDVSFATGNVNYTKSVTVDGDIKSGFKVECGGDLQVSGTIEDAEVVVGGNLLSKLGFIGSGKGLIDAKGDVNVGFVKNQVIRSRKNVIVAKEVLNSTIFARKSVTIHGNPLSVAGGAITARDSITVFTVGNNSGIRTILEVGLDFALQEELKKTEAMLAELALNKQKIHETIKKYDQLIAVKKKLAPKEEFLFNKLKATQLKFDQQLKILEDRKKIISSRLYDFANAYIKIDHAAMPGTIFKIGERKHLVKQEIVGPKSVRYIDQEIRIL